MKKRKLRKMLVDVIAMNADLQIEVCKLQAINRKNFDHIQKMEGELFDLHCQNDKVAKGESDE